MKRILIVLGMSICVILLISSCSYNPRMEESVVKQMPAGGKTFESRLYVEQFVGGSQQSQASKIWLGDYMISLEMLRETINQSVEITDLFELSEEEGSEYILQGEGIESRWSGGFSLRGILKMKYKLVNKASGETVWEDKIETEVVKTTGDAFNGQRRRQILIEAVYREHVQSLFAKLSVLELP